jgi:hypothetical protein
MDSSVKTVIGIGIAVFTFTLIAVMGTMIFPIFEGTGRSVATATGTTLTALTNATNASAVQTATTQGTVYSFLPYIAVVFGLIVLIFGRNFIKEMIGGKSV